MRSLLAIFLGRVEVSQDQNWIIGKFFNVQVFSHKTHTDLELALQGNSHKQSL